MSVSSHLAIDLREYDSRIRTFIPHYEDMLAVVAATVRLRQPRAVVDLGTGTGALAALIARAVPGATLTGIDEDAGMLAVARRRLRRRQATLQHGSFLSVDLPACEAITASFALHHVARAREKRALYKRAHAALGAGGLLVSADCHPSGAAWLADRGREAWLAHLTTTYGRAQARRYLEAWSHEDFYTTLEDEARLLASAGFTPHVVWRRDQFAVIVAERPGRAPRTRR